MPDASYHINVERLEPELRGVNTVDPNFSLTLIQTVSSALDLGCQEEFEPIHESRIVYPNVVSISPDYVFLKLIDAETQRPMRLLELEAVVSGTRTLTVGTDVALEYAPLHSRRLVLLKNNLSWSRFCNGIGWNGTTFCGARTRFAVQVTGWWGYRERYATQGWQAVDVLDSDLTADADDDVLSLQGNHTDPGKDGFAPVIAAGTLLRIGDEVMRAWTVNPDDPQQVSKVLRGLKGTELAVHEQDDPVSVWSVQPEIVRAAQRWATLLYGRKGVFETSTVTEGGGIIRYPEDIPGDVRALLWRFLQ